MSKHNQGSHWSKGLLKERGWTNEQIETLLPPPIFLRRRNYTVPVWPREVIRAVEESPAFRQGAAPSAR